MLTTFLQDVVVILGFIASSLAPKILQRHQIEEYSQEYFQPNRQKNKNIQLRPKKNNIVI